MKIEHKTFDSEIKAADDATLTIEHWISTEEKDRGGDRMVADGMIVKGRPVVLLMHGRGAMMGAEPVAKPIDIRVESFRGKKGVVAKTQFFPDAVGQRLYEKVRDGFMPNFSIGYGVIKSEDVYKDGKFDARLVSKWELYEYSLVSVGMNAGATTFKDGEALSFKLLPDDAAEGCCGDCKGDVKCAGHREKPEGDGSTPDPEPCPTCKATMDAFSTDGRLIIGFACAKCDPAKHAELTKAIAPPPEPETPIEKFKKDAAALGITFPDDPMKAIDEKIATLEGGYFGQQKTINDLIDAIKDFKKQAAKLEPLLKTLPPEPDGGEEGKGSDGNPPEPKRLVFHDSRKEERELEEAAKARRRVVVEAVRSHLHAAASQQADKLLGKVH